MNKLSLLLHQKSELRNQNKMFVMCVFCGSVKF